MSLWIFKTLSQWKLDPKIQHSAWLLARLGDDRMPLREATNPNWVTESRSCPSGLACSWSFYVFLVCMSQRCVLSWCGEGGPGHYVNWFCRSCSGVLKEPGMLKVRRLDAFGLIIFFWSKLGAGARQSTSSAAAITGVKPTGAARVRHSNLFMPSSQEFGIPTAMTWDDLWLRASREHLWYLWESAIIWYTVYTVIVLCVFVAQATAAAVLV